MLTRSLSVLVFLLVMVSAAAAETREVTLKELDPAQTVLTLRKIFEDLKGLEIVALPSGKANTLRITGSASDLDEVEKTIAELQTPGKSAPGTEPAAQEGTQTIGEPAKASAGPRPSYKVFRLRASAADIARSLVELFPHAQIVSEPVNNLLIVSAPQADVEIVEALVTQMDVPPGRVAISVIVAEIAGGPGDAWEPKGSFAEASRQIEELAKKGSGSILRRMQLTTIDNQAATVQIGEEVSVVTGVSRFGPRGEMQRTTQRENVGTLLRCTPRSAGGDVTMELMFEMSRFLPAEAPAAVPGTPAGPGSPGGSTITGASGPAARGTGSGFDDGSAAAAAPLTPQKQVATFRGTVLIPSGRAVALTDFATKDVGGPTRIIMLLGADAN